MPLVPLLLALAGSNPALPARAAAVPAVPATSTAAPPVLDGRDDDPAWHTAPEITQFRQFAPREDGEPALRTAARILHDARYLYVLIRAYDPHPDSIVSLLSRRDRLTASDRVHVLIDSYHDRKSGFAFSVTPGGVRIDAAIINDQQEDGAWDGVWDVATRVDSLGWLAEFRIPFSQLRFTHRDSLSFGLALVRDVARTGERMSWPVMRRSRPGISSQFGELAGLRGLDAPRRLELVPYSVVRMQGQPRGDGRVVRATNGTIGADLKLGLAAGLRLDATLNPDFGQVDADPSVINLGVFEQIYEERRPFFLEGAGLFRYDITCGGVACNGLFYSRRVGRAPQLAARYGQTAAVATTILGATKLTGRTAGGLNIGLLTALTAREATTGGRTTEPTTHYGVLRLQQDWRGGLSSAGIMVTRTDRANDEWTRPWLRDDATVIGFDTRHRVFNGRYLARAYGAVSRVTGSAPAMRRTRQSSAHYYQRPDDGVALDTTAAALDGTVLAASIGKQGGGITRWGTAVRLTSQGFEPNDMGFLFRSDYNTWQNNFGLAFNRPTRFTRQANLHATLYGIWNSAGQSLGGQSSLTAYAQFPNLWTLNTQLVLDGFGGNAIDDRLTRGGPVVRRNAITLGSVFLAGDERRALVPRLGVRGQPLAADGSWQLGVDPSLALRRGERVQAQFGLSYLRTVNAVQWMGAFSDTMGTRYTFARLDQRMLSLTSRFDLTATPTLSLQVYAAPFVAVGRHDNWKELVDAKASRPTARMRPFTDRGSPASANFNLKQLRTNAVVRWEYRAGSTLYVVWSQGRDQGDRNAGDFRAGRDLTDLFRATPNNMLQLKASYWFTPGWRSR